MFVKDMLPVALGGACGAVLRFTVGVLLRQFTSQTGFPLATLIVNVVGAFILGLLIFRPDNHLSRFWLLFITTGFLGSLTTFSTFKVETVKLLDDTKLFYACLYFIGNVVLGLGAVLLAKRIVNV